jgi:hypothetical protein
VDPLCPVHLGPGLGWTITLCEEVEDGSSWAFEGFCSITNFTCNSNPWFLQLCNVSFKKKMVLLEIFMMMNILLTL